MMRTVLAAEKSGCSVSIGAFILFCIAAAIVGCHNDNCDDDCCPVPANQVSATEAPITNLFLVTNESTRLQAVVLWQDENVIRIQPVYCLVFTMQGCGHCEVLETQITKQLLPLGWKLGNAKAGGDIEYIDVNSGDARAKEFRIRACPTLILVDATGKQLERREGGVNAKQLSEWINATRKR